MSSIEVAASVRTLSSRLFRHAPAIFALTLFVSALLLFAVQPMFTKMVLPKLGGAPAIWSVAMVFFQTALLLGYAYAHWLTKYFVPRHAALIHLGILGLAALSLPLGIANGFGTPPSQNIEIWLLALFAASIGLPFTALAASAPLLQRWFSDSGHPRAANPYVLYAASNLGSFAALLSYPVLIEPFMTLREQTAAWAAGFALLAILIATAGLVVASVAVTKPASRVNAASPAIAARLSWVGLAAIPAGLVVAVTAHISTDVAAAPFLWVVPLALYLLTFVAVFNEKPWVSHETVVRLVPYVIAPLAISMLGGDRAFWLVAIALHLISFFVLTLLCHGELYRRRPAPERLTDFYLATSIGGVLGGVFTGLIAPNVFSTTTEYPILVAAAVLALPGVFSRGLRDAFSYAAGPLTLAAVLFVIHTITGWRIAAEWMIAFQAVLISLAALILFSKQAPARIFGLVVLAFAFSGLWQPGQMSVETTRSFFGVHKIADSADGNYRLLFHGTTIHGADKIRNEDKSPVSGRAEPLAYYYRGGPISETILSTRAMRGGRLMQVAAVGLGTGSLACYREPGENWTFFEIDPEVVRLARDQQRFRFISSCAPDMPVVLGDARLTLSATQTKYDLIILDAFSSDAIPAHLLTREAVAGYLSRLNPGGVIVMHISNRHLELSQIVAAVGASEGLVTLVKTDTQASNFAKDYHSNATVAALARDWRDLSRLSGTPGWEPVAANGVLPWTDDYSDLISSLIRKKF